MVKASMVRLSLLKGIDYRSPTIATVAVFITSVLPPTAGRISGGPDPGGC
jgi:hypothetical protein